MHLTHAFNLLGTRKNIHQDQHGAPRARYAAADLRSSVSSWADTLSEQIGSGIRLGLRGCLRGNKGNLEDKGQKRGLQDSNDSTRPDNVISRDSTEGIKAVKNVRSEFGGLFRI